ncbi:MAG: hypothetical protein HC902_11800 [Calothrix sp. SM1_5_4]|nr:hypothetical protein [Calothrix sp. SM1_5_4]
MRHNKIIGWDKFLKTVEQVQKLSPWLSRQIVKRASEWPFFFSGLQIQEWHDRQVRLHMPHSFRNAVDGEICHGHLLLGAELALRLVLLRYREEFPFRYRILSSRTETHHPVDQPVDYKFEIGFAEWEAIRLDLARESRAREEFVFQAYLADGRMAATFSFQVQFEMERFLPS